MRYLVGHAAIEEAARNGWMVSKFADATEGAVEELSLEKAREVAQVDPSLVYLGPIPVVRGLVRSFTEEEKATVVTFGSDHWDSRLLALPACKDWTAGDLVDALQIMDELCNGWTPSA